MRPLALAAFVVLGACDTRESARAPSSAASSSAASSSAASSSAASSSAAKATSSAAPTATTTMPTTTASADDRPIGNAKMEPDGTLVLDLYADTPDGKSRGMAQLRKKPGDKDYDDWLKHLGGMKPGEQKLVPPWPDD